MATGVSRVQSERRHFRARDSSRRETDRKTDTQTDERQIRHRAQNAEHRRARRAGSRPTSASGLPKVCRRRSRPVASLNSEETVSWKVPAPKRSSFALAA